MDKFIIKTMLMALCLAFIPSLRGSAFNPKGLQKAVQAVTKSTEKSEKAAEKLLKEMEKSNPNKLQQAARETGSNGYGYAGARAGQVAMRSVQCRHCHGSGYAVIQGTRMRCGFCNGTGRVMQAMNAVPSAVEKPSEPFWKSTWFIVACCGTLLLGGGYYWGKAS